MKKSPRCSLGVSQNVKSPLSPLSNRGLLIFQIPFSSGILLVGEAGFEPIDYLITENDN